jgi:predicted DNA-binding transcriptional regulator YafY
MNDKNPPIQSAMVQSRRGLKILSPELLFHWLMRPRHPVFASSDSLAKSLIAAWLKGHPADIIYLSGSTPGLPRTVEVSLVFQHEPAGRIYIQGYCTLRRANRIFALDRIMYMPTRN